jgi:thioredoxin
MFKRDNHHTESAPHDAGGTGREIPDVTDESFDATIAGRVTVVDFHAAWCGPCRQFSPTFERAAAHDDGSLQFVRCNVDESPRTAVRYGILSIPTVVLVDGAGQVIDRFSGVAGPGQLHEFLYGEARTTGAAAGA